MPLTEATYREACALVAARLGLAIPETRRADLEHAIEEAARGAGAPSPAAYLAQVARAPDDSPLLLDLASRVTVTETYFFRDRAAFEALERHVLPALVAARRAQGRRWLRLWSAGCATGEEPYSLAIVLDRLLPDRADWTLTLLATDIHPGALAAAQRGRYREWAFRDTPADIRARYFRPRGAGRFEVARHIRQLVTFRLLNLAGAAYPAAATDTEALDLVLCRNVLMYFTPEARRAAAHRLAAALAPGGWLIVSPTEAAADLFAGLVPVNFPGAVFFRRAEAAAPAPVPVAAMPLKHPRDGAGSSIGAPDANPRPPPPAPARRGPQAATPPAPAPAARDELLRRARTLADRGTLTEARACCEAALAQEPLDAEAYLLLAAICEEQGDLAAATRALRRAIYLAPDAAPAYWHLGALLRRQGRGRRGERLQALALELLQAEVPAGRRATRGEHER